MATSRRLRFANGSRRKRTFQSDFSDACQPLESRLLMAVNVLTYHNDNQRDGANLQETTLTPSNVNVYDFGKLKQVGLDGQVYTQPLVMSNVKIPRKGIHNVVYVATENDSVYALDARTLKPLWHDSFINPSAEIIPVPTSVVNLTPIEGITSTPVIDPTTETMYVVTAEQVPTATGATVIQLLHALNLSTGAEKFGGPVPLSGSVPGNGPDSVNGHIIYNPAYQNQRSALLLSNGVISIASSFLEAGGTYHGWVLGYSASTLKQMSAFVDSPTSPNSGGIWMAGSGPAADAAGNIYLATGNGLFNPGGADFADSVLKFTNDLQTVSDYSTPMNQLYLQQNDLDLGSGGVVLLPPQPGATPDEMVAAGKDGEIYLINRDNLGRYSTTSNTSIQALSGALTSSFGTPAYFNGTIYYAQAGGPLEAFSLINGQIDPTPVTGSRAYNWPGASPSVSANGTKNGIVWTIDGSPYGGPAILTAYNATNITQVLYSSNLDPSRDLPGTFNKYTPPTIANGLVYVAGQDSLTLYGILPPGKRLHPRPAAKTPPARHVAVKR